MKLSDAAKLERFQIALTNATTNADSFRAVWLPGTDKAGGAVVMRLFRIKRIGGTC